MKSENIAHGLHRILRIPAVMIFVCLCTISHAQRNTSFQHSYGGSSDDFGGSILKLPDNGYVMTGFTKSFGSGGYDIIVIRVDSLGKEMWSNAYGGSEDEGNVSFYVYPSMDVTLSPDTNIVICSNTESYGKGGKDVYLLKLDLNGNVKWSRTYGGLNDDIGYAVINDPNGGFLIAGETSSYGAGNGDVWLIKANDTGGVVWTNTYGDASNEEAGYRIIPTMDGNYLIAGYSNNSPYQFDQMLIKVNKNGKFLWSNVFGTSAYDLPNDVIELPDKSIYFDGASNGSMVVTKLDSLGNLKWTKTYASGSFRSMTYDGKKNVINIFGTAGAGVVSGNDQRIFIARLDTSGNYKFSNSYGPASTTKSYTIGEGHLMLNLANGGLIALGAESVCGAGDNDIFLIKSDSGNNTNSCDLIPFSMSPIQYSFLSHNYSFSTLSVSPGILGGVKVVSCSSISDSVICSPFVANFGFQRKTDHNIQFSDSSYYGAISWSWDFGESTSPSNSSPLKNPVHIYQNPGTYNVKLIVSNSANDRDSMIKTVKIVLTGISNQSDEKLSAQIYPNPANNLLHVMLSEPQSQMIIISDLLGKTVYQTQTNVALEDEIETEYFVKGLYIINIITSKGNITSRFVKE